jgi:hypothetical protein
MKIERFTGINNRIPPDRFKADEGGGMPVHDAVNVDLSAAGTFQSRAGFTPVVELPDCRSAFSVDDTGSLVAVGDELHRFNGSALTKVDDLGSSFARVAYAKTPIGVSAGDAGRRYLIVLLTVLRSGTAIDATQQAVARL